MNVNEKSYILHTAQGVKIYTGAEVINNALEQEKAGIIPRFLPVENKYNVPAGWLVWSTYRDGAGVVYRAKNGEMVITTGWQADYVETAGRVKKC